MAKAKKAAVGTDATTTYKDKYPKETQRVNLDLPTELYDAIQEHVKNHGQTMKGFFIVAANSYLQS